MKQKLPFLLLIASGLLIVFYFYGRVILQPDNYMFASSGDGMKNYFTYSSHIKNDSSHVNFEGMNYPYGEHFMYTDCHPVLAAAFKALSVVFPFFGDHSIGILNFLMIASVFLTFIVIYVLLAELGVNRWLSVIFSIGITLLAPQIFRMGLHQALSYSVAIPFSWLLIIKSLRNGNPLKYMILIFLNNLFWLFIHAYLGIIISFFLIMIHIIFLVSDKDRMKTFRRSLNLFASLILPIVLFFLFVKITDTHTGRTDNPSGFFNYVAEADDVFVPNHPPLRTLLDSLMGNGIRQQWEAWSYVGISTTLMFLIFIFMGISRLIKRKPTTIDRFFGLGIMNVSLMAAFIVLLFAMAVPFRQIPVLTEIVPFVKEFRALGRFTWPFYFAATLFTAIVISKIYETAPSRKSRMIAVGLAFTAGLANIVEALPYHREMAWTITQSSNLFQRANLSKSFNSAIDAINTNDYQAIISLPFFYVGSESYSRPRNDETTRSSMVFSYHTGMPLVCANLTRTSIQESKNIVQLVSPDFYKKGIGIDLPDNRPFLVIRTRDAITGYEELILKKCTTVYQSDEISLYSLQKSDLFRSSAPDIITNFKTLDNSLFRNEEFYLSKDSSFFYYNDFESFPSEEPFRGKGGFQSVKKDKNVLAEFGPGTFIAGKSYHLSAWMFNGRPDALNLYFRFIVEEYNQQTDSWESTTFLPEQSEVIYGDWSLVEGVFAIKNPQSKIYIVTIGTRDAKGPLFIDDLLIKEKGTDVYRLFPGDSMLFYNNHAVPAIIPLRQ